MYLSLEMLDPNSVPHRTLYTGAKVPAVGLGTFGSDRFLASEIAEAVLGAAAIGYRHFDCGAVYGNEREIGVSLQKIMNRGIAREDLWITSKLWNDKHAEEDVIPACKRTLQDLQLEYLDLYLIHWPFPNHHAPGVDVNSRDPHAVPYIHENYMKTWRQMEKLVEMGLVRHIGTSNMSIPKLKMLFQDAKIRPAANEMELHPHFQQPELFQFCVQHHLTPIGYAPIGSPRRPERDRTPADTVDVEDPVILKIAERLKVHPAVVCIKWAVQRGQIPIPFSIRPHQYWANLRAAVTDPLTEEEMLEIAGIDKNNRLIKGQVFLWQSAKDWRDLWDIEGIIVSP
jgi:diketogulonate reductase-like aldo/keto reductase